MALPQPNRYTVWAPMAGAPNLEMEIIMSSAKKKAPVNPLASAAIVGAKSKARDAIERVAVTDEAVAAAVVEYARLDAAKKDAEAAAKPCKESILTAARDLFVERLASGNSDTFALAAGDVTIQVAVPRKISSLGEAELKALTEDFGEGVGDFLLEQSPKVSLNLKVWEAHETALVAALNAKDADGRPLVPTEVLQALFTREVKARDDLFTRAAERTNHDVTQLKTLLFGKLGISPSLTVR